MFQLIASQMLDVRLPFDEAALLRENEEYLLRTVGHGLTTMEVTTADAGVSDGADVALPGRPHVMLS